MGRMLDDDWVAAVQKGCNWRTLFEANNLYGDDELREVYRHDFGLPATEEQLAAAETELGVKLPPHPPAAEHDEQDQPDHPPGAQTSATSTPGR